jgi:hypothetical protein
MKLTTQLPRSRPEHLAAIPAPEGCDAPVLALSRNGKTFLAERDPTEATYQVMLPALSSGEAAVFEVEGTEAHEPAAGIETNRGPGRVDISLAGSPLMTFHHGPTYPKPVINPILSPGGVNMLREPMAAYADGEHPWQRGLTLMQGAINGVDCWNERDTEGYGRTEQEAMALRHGPVSAVIESDNTWYEKDRPLMSDHRTYRLYDTGREAAVLDICLTLKATHGPVTIGDTKEAGFLCLRVNPTMNAADGGTMRNAYGASDETGCWSKPSHWMDYYGPVGDEVAGFGVFDHPGNFRYPTTWHVRGYGLFAPNCWMFKPDHVLRAGEELTFRWRVVIHAGDTAAAGIADRFLDYVDGPRAEWE